MPRYFYPGSARNTVESTLSFSTFWLNRNHYLDGGLSIGGIKWSRNGEETGSMGFSVDINNQLINFNYRSKGYWDKDWQEISYQCKLEKIPCFLVDLGGFSGVIGVIGDVPFSTKATTILSVVNVLTYPMKVATRIAVSGRVYLGF